MHFNKSFTTYRRTLASSQYTYSATAIITNGSCWVQPASSELRAVLGVEQAIQAYELFTEESNLQVSDKVVIDSANYYIQELEIVDQNGINFSHAILFKDK